jgi:hypothetical protein
VKEASHAVTQLHGKAITPADIAAAEAAAAVAEDAAAAAAAAAGKGSKKGKAKQAAKQSAKQLKQQQAAAAAAAAAAAGTEGGVVLWARHVSGEGALVKKWRLILRNMPFQVIFSLLLMFAPMFVLHFYYSVLWCHAQSVLYMLLLTWLDRRLWTPAACPTYCSSNSHDSSVCCTLDSWTTQCVRALLLQMLSSSPWLGLNYVASCAGIVDGCACMRSCHLAATISPVTLLNMHELPVFQLLNLLACHSITSRRR